MYELFMGDNKLILTRRLQNDEVEKRFCWTSRSAEFRKFLIFRLLLKAGEELWTENSSNQLDEPTLHDELLQCETDLPKLLSLPIWQ